VYRLHSLGVVFTVDSGLMFHEFSLYAVGILTVFGSWAFTLNY
jgi:hypothetical protein